MLLLNMNLYKWRTMSRVSCVDFHCEGVFIGVNETSTDLERSVWHQVVAGRPSHVASRSGGAASTDSGLSSLCSCVATKAQDKSPQTLADRPLGRLGLGSGPLGSHVKYIPVVMMILTFGQLHFAIS
jgi:hypothetical protein